MSWASPARTKPRCTPSWPSSTSRIVSRRRWNTPRTSSRTAFPPRTSRAARTTATPSPSQSTRRTPKTSMTPSRSASCRTATTKWACTSPTCPGTCARGAWLTRRPASAEPPCTWWTAPCPCCRRSSATSFARSARTRTSSRTPSSSRSAPRERSSRDGSAVPSSAPTPAWTMSRRRRS